MQNRKLSELEKALARVEWLVLGRIDNSLPLTVPEKEMIDKLIERTKKLPYVPVL